MRVGYAEVTRKRNHKKNMRMTVVASDGTILAQNYRIAANRSVIVTRSGGVQPQEYGGDLWTDENNVNHRPK